MQQANIALSFFPCRKNVFPSLISFLLVCTFISCNGSKVPPIDCNDADPKTVRHAPLTIDPLEIDFVNGSSDKRMVTIKNSGSDVLKLESLQIGGTNPGSFTIETDGCSNTTLSSGNRCSVYIKFIKIEAFVPKAVLYIPAEKYCRDKVDITGYARN